LKAEFTIVLALTAAAGASMALDVACQLYAAAATLPW
jgi:hypothetical protein